jgi:uncharacterized membrane protein YeaQ/YmgE (transglycosylase-associated protein family)
VVFILNVLFGFLGGFLASYASRRLGADDRVSFVVGAIVGIMVYLMSFAGRLI